MAQVRAFRRCFSDSRLQERRHQTRLSNKNAVVLTTESTSQEWTLTHRADPVPEALEEAGGCARPGVLRQWALKLPLAEELSFIHRDGVLPSVLGKWYPGGFSSHEEPNKWMVGSADCMILMCWASSFAELANKVILISVVYVIGKNLLMQAQLGSHISEWWCSSGHAYISINVMSFSAISRKTKQVRCLLEPLTGF